MNRNCVYGPENRISESLGAISDPELSGSGIKTSGIYPIFRTSVGSLLVLKNLLSTKIAAIMLE